MTYRLFDHMAGTRKAYDNRIMFADIDFSLP